ncbi:sensor histidine kinase [Streptomyces fuscigenes]|uniref:sensor histidine kinase n=1 Tax=Streptomyces fuscigenes TaxID=1528880 RepID=UPI001F253017|nr:sensor histidine kinase [Streptomyces fuscigenes]MCF3961153.1 ATP-binding protein [Streptomyces fuscigenes]
MTVEAHPDPSAGRRLVAGWTTRRWLAWGTAGAFVVFLGLSALGTWTLAHSTAINNRLVDHSTPALIASTRLEGAVLEQESAISAYGATGRSSFLAGYRDARNRQDAAVKQLTALARADPATARDLDRVRGRIATWQHDFAEAIAEAENPRSAAADRGSADASAFAPVRAALGRQQDAQQAQRAGARRDLADARTLRNATFSAIAAVLTALFVLVFVALRQGVTRPMDRLSADVRTVAHGDFTHPVTGTGPADFRLLAADVEAMRRRLTAELGFSQDARARMDEQATELRRSNAELEQFAYVASHDLQEPLRKVASFCQLLERRYAAELDERARTYIHFAVDGAQRMQTLINDLLDFSRVGRLHTDRTRVDLEKTFTDAHDALGLAIEDGGARVTHDVLPTVDADPTQMGMLLQNLISNALKFRAPERAPRVHLSARPDEAGLWRFELADNGIGIGPDQTERVFVIFQRLHTREQYPGNGIGLALCKKIVEYHGGTIGVDSDHTPGLKIFFTLPVSEATTDDHDGREDSPQ